MSRVRAGLGGGGGAAIRSSGYGCLGRLVEGVTAGPPNDRWPPFFPPRVVTGEFNAAAFRLSAEGFSATASSRALAIARAVASSLRSGRWLGGLRFEMAGDSWKNTFQCPDHRQIACPRQEDTTTEVRRFDAITRRSIADRVNGFQKRKEDFRKKTPYDWRSVDAIETCTRPRRVPAQRSRPRRFVGLGPRGKMR